VAERPRGSLPIALGALALASACASLAPAPPGAPERARAARTYSATLGVSLRSPTLRGRATVILAFARPHSLRLEVPGPTGLVCVAVANETALVAVFPGARAAWQGASTAAEMEALLGVRLSPRELMDLLVGMPSPGVRDYRVSWGAALPKRVMATLEDGGRLDAKVQSADLDPTLPDAAFDLPGREGLRQVDAAEARRLLGMR